MKKLVSSKGFTLIELVMVIVILGILAAVAVPKFADLTGKASRAAMDGVVGGVRSGISMFQADILVNYGAGNTNGSGVASNSLGYPTALDATTGQASPVNPLYINVLAQGGITDEEWNETGSGTYTYTSPDSVFTWVYTAAAGTFNPQ